jgi:hypothetical protein
VLAEGELRTIADQHDACSEVRVLPGRQDVAEHVDGDRELLGLGVGHVAPT